LWSQSPGKECDSLFPYLGHLLARKQIIINEQPCKLNGHYLCGTYNQFSKVKRTGEPWPENASGSSCALNMLCFLRAAFECLTYKDIASEPEAKNNRINQILDEGRETFEILVAKQRASAALLAEEMEKEDRLAAERIK